MAGMTQGLIVPLAIEYPFWNERLPEALVAFGEAIDSAAAPAQSAAAWNSLLAARLEATQDRLAAAAAQRNRANFQTLLTGKVGVGGIYDLVRRAGAWRRGERFDASHGGAEAGAEP